MRLTCTGLISWFLHISAASEESLAQMYNMARNADSSNVRSMQHITSSDTEESQEAFQLHNYTFELDDLDMELRYLTAEPHLSGPQAVLGDGILHPEGAQLSSSTPPSLLSPHNGSQSAALQFSDFSLSDAECGSPLSPATPDYMLLPLTDRIRHRGPPFRASSEPTITAGLLPPSTLGHLRSHSMSSVPRAHVATQAMLEANERRRRHQPQFQCAECGQVFTAQFSLKRHQLSHTGERPYTCSIPGCGQKFFNSDDCKRHEKSKKRHSNL